MSPQPIIEPPSSMTLSSSSDSSDDDLPIDRNPPKPTSVKIPTPIAPPVIKPRKGRERKTAKNKSYFKTIVIGSWRFIQT